MTTLKTVSALLVLMASTCGAALAQPDPDKLVTATARGVLVTPGASLERARDRGRAAHANVHVLRLARNQPDAAAAANSFETPASLACLYGLAPAVVGCNPQTLTRVASGGSRMIAIVDAYHYPTAAADLATFSTKFRLPAPSAANFAVVYASGTQPAADPTGGWPLEAALDIEMAHALAPGAKVVLVEAASNGFADLFAAEQAAAKMVAAAGGGEVSNSWSGGEFSGEAGAQTAFTGTNVVFFASAGDTPGTGVPSALTNVISVGGTTINRDANGNFLSQTTWTDTGGGLSPYLAAPTYQHAVTPVVGAMRGTPDIALVANPNSGVWVYDSTPYDGAAPGWIVVGGTSVASPASAAIVNNAGSFRASTAAELAVMYANMHRTKAYTDVTSGSCPNATSGTASVGYDLCTGIGTLLGRAAK